MIIKVDVVGATGYAGQELVSILLKHPSARVHALYSTTDEPKKFASLFPRFKGRTSLEVRKLDARALVSSDASVVFLALPHTCSMGLVPQLLKAGKRVIDLGADYRLKDSRLYEKFYGVSHTDSVNLRKAVYGLPELYRQKIKKAKLVANPGCYPTCGILALAPLAALEQPVSIIIDAKSGTSGAGKKAVQEMLFTEVDEDFHAYKVGCHQHAPEIEQELGKLAGKKTAVTFVPHLLPLKRGILETIYVTGVKEIDCLSLYRKFYKREPFVRVREAGEYPSLKDVAGTNFCDIGIKSCKDTTVIIAAIDNLVKGAAGQAVQNLNIMMGFPETAGL